MKNTVITIGTEQAPYCRFSKNLPGLLWCELVRLLGEWKRFENKQKGTRFDRWLK